MWLKEFWVRFKVIWDCFSLLPWEQFTSGFPAAWHSIRHGEFPDIFLLLSNLPKSFYTYNVQSKPQQSLSRVLMLGTDELGLLLREPPAESFAKAIVQVPLITSFCRDSINGLELLWQFSFIPSGNNIGLVGVFSLWKRHPPPCSDTQSRSFREHYFTFLSCFAFLAQGEILACKMLLAFKVNCLRTGFPYLFEFSQKLTSKCSTGIKAVISPQGISFALAL